MDILNQSGPQFLSTYCFWAVITLLVAVVAKKVCLFNKIQPLNETTIDEYDIAYLSGGDERAFLSGIAMLVRKGVVSIDSIGRALELKVVDIATISRLHPFERAIYDAARTGGTIESLKKDVRRNLNEIENRLTGWHLLPSPERSAMGLIVSSCVLFALPVAIGIPKMIIGLERGKPVFFLVLLIITSLCVSLWLVNRGAHRTRSGDLLVSQLQNDNAALMSTFSCNSNSLATADLTLAYALFGATCMGLMDPFLTARAALRPPVTTSGSGCGGSSGGCGGGSCGGGGCGGCGGG